MKLFLKAHTEQLIRNGQLLNKDSDLDLKPVVKLFTADAQMTWLLISFHPEVDDLAYGLCDLGIGMPELGYVSISELETTKGMLGLPIERDMFFTAEHTLSVYSQQACKRGYVVA